MAETLQDKLIEARRENVRLKREVKEARDKYNAEAELSMLQIENRELESELRRLR